MKDTATERWGLFALALFSAVVLAYEVFLTRLLAYSLDTTLLYVVLAVAMLGFGAAGSLVAVRRSWLDAERVERALAWAALAFVPALVVAVGLFVRITDGLTEAGFFTVAAASLLALPFLAAGVVITLALSSASAKVGRRYAANLIGSGVGCFIPPLLLRPLGGEGFLGMLTLAAWAAAAVYVLRSGNGLRSRLGGALALCLAFAAGTAALAPQVFAIQPEPQPLGQLDKITRHSQSKGYGVHKRYDRWNPTGRIEILLFEPVPGHEGPYPYLFYAQDSSAGSFLTRWDGRDSSQVRPSAQDPASEVSRNCTQTLFAQGHYKPHDKVLVIGIGGAPDIQCALYHRARQVDAVEINEDSIAAVSGPFDRWLGGVGSDPRVHYHHRDGRSFARGARGRGYDLITLSGVDTKSALASGSLALAENHLYTQEAFHDYLLSLSDTGSIAILRFGEWEALRLANTAATALRELGAEAPERHIAVYSMGVLHGVLVKRTPFTEAELQQLAGAFDAEDPAFYGTHVFFYEIFGFPQRQAPLLMYATDQASVGQFGRYFHALAEQRVDGFQTDYPFDVSPTHDDRPFFFDVFRYDRAETWRAPHVKTLGSLLSSILLLSALFIMGPVWRKRELSPGGFAGKALLYFGSVGIAYLMIEVWLFHRFGMFLGHQTHAVTVVLSSLLVSTGIGAALGERLLPEPGRRVSVGVAVVIAWTLLGLFGIDPLLETLWDRSLLVKASLAAAYVAPLGMAMGLPFPAGLAWADRAAPQAVPWCVGVNAFASVLATVLVIPLSLALGYQAICLIALVLYGVARAANIR